MTGTTLRATLAGAALCVALAPLSATAASLLSSAVAVEHPFPGFFPAEELDGLYGRETTSTLSVPQFDPIFGTLTEVRLHVDSSFDLEIPFLLTPPSREEFDPFFFWDYDAGVTIDGVGNAGGENVNGSFSYVVRTNVGTLTVHDRDVTTLTTGPDGWSGTGTRSLDLVSRQFVDLDPGGDLSYLLENCLSFPCPSRSEVVSSLRVEYVFEPGVQSLDTTVGLLTFSSAFRPEVVLTRNDATVVPLPAGLPLMAAALALLGLAARRRR